MNTLALRDSGVYEWRVTGELFAARYEGGTWLLDAIDDDGNYKPRIAGQFVAYALCEDGRWAELILARHSITDAFMSGRTLSIEPSDLVEIANSLQEFGESQAAMNEQFYDIMLPVMNRL